MDYKEKYEQALSKARQFSEKPYLEDSAGIVEYIFPELASEDERIRKEIIDFAIKANNGVTSILANNYDFNSWLDWLKKQGEQKPIDKIQLGKKYKCIASPRYSTFMIGKIYKPEDKFLCNLMNFCYDCFEPIEDSEQKPADKIEPKFKVGDKIRRKTPSSFDTDMEVARIDKDYYICNHIGKFSSEVVPFSKESSYELVEQKPTNKVEPKFKVGDTVKDPYGAVYHIIEINNDSYKTDDGRFILFKNEDAYTVFTPAGLEKQGEQKAAELPEGEDYGIDGLWHAINILQRTLGEVEGYQSDDGILEHKCAITAVKKLYEQNPAWSEEDIEMLNSAISFVEHSAFTTIGKGKNNVISWLKSLKDRVQPQPKQE